MGTRHSTTTLLIEALRLVQVQGWPVARGTYLVDAGCSCLDARCAAPGLHPADPWPTRATGDRSQIEAWWSEHPQAGIVLPTGSHLDVLDVPPGIGSDVLGALEKYPEHLGPVAATGAGRVLFFVQPGARRAAPTVWARYDAQRRLGFDWDLRLHDRGDYVVAPPSGRGGPHSVTWLVSPYSRDAGVRPLPPASALLPHVATSCRGGPGPAPTQLAKPRSA